MRWLHNRLFVPRVIDSDQEMLDTATGHQEKGAVQERHEESTSLLGRGLRHRN